MVKKVLGIAVVVAAILIFIQEREIRSLRAESEKYKTNTTALMEEVTHYKLRDSLNGARADALQLSIKEVET